MYMCIYDTITAPDAKEAKNHRKPAASQETPAPLWGKVVGRNSTFKQASTGKWGRAWQLWAEWPFVSSYSINKLCPASNHSLTTSAPSHAITSTVLNIQASRDYPMAPSGHKSPETLPRLPPRGHHCRGMQQSNATSGYWETPRTVHPIYCPWRAGQNGTGKWQANERQPLCYEELQKASSML